MTEIFSSISGGWTAISTWIMNTLQALQAVFYGDSGLTFLGALAVTGVGIGVIFLLIGVIQNFLHLRS